jgi:hypothetical protein
MRVAFKTTLWMSSRQERAARPRDLLVTLFLALLLGCASMGQQAEEEEETEPPTLERLRPDSVFVAPGSVVAVTLIGSGFEHGSTGANTVHFGRNAIRGVSANYDGTRITFVVPDAIDSGGEAPPVRVITGSYPVQVETTFGKSNVLMLRVVR